MPWKYWPDAFPGIICSSCRSLERVHHYRCCPPLPVLYIHQSDGHFPRWTWICWLPTWLPGKISGEGLCACPSRRQPSRSFSGPHWVLRELMLLPSCWIFAASTQLYRQTAASFSGQPGSAGITKVKPICIFMKQEMMGWQWHQFCHMQITCTSLQTDNHANTSSLNFFTDQMLFLTSNRQCQSTEGPGCVAGLYIYATVKLVRASFCSLTHTLLFGFLCYHW